MRRLAVLTALLLVPAAAAHAAGPAYVALGDSYTSGPLVPMQHGTPIDCGRSDRNAPTLTAAGLSLQLRDVSCGSAETKHMTQPQTGLPAGGTNPPQFNGLHPDAQLVTIGIGGNDIALPSAVVTCAQLGLTNRDPGRHACREHFNAGGRDELAERIATAAPRVATVLRQIHERAPRRGATADVQIWIEQHWNGSWREVGHGRGHTRAQTRPNRLPSNDRVTARRKCVRYPGRTYTYRTKVDVDVDGTWDSGGQQYSKNIPSNCSALGRNP